MDAKVLHIEDKIKKIELDLAKLGDFRYRVESTVDARIILERPEITLYCLDDENRQAVFVESTPGVDCSQHPFFFLTQYQNAKRLFTVTYDGLNELGASVGDPFKRLIPMYSVGRAGGTLVSRAFNRIDTVLSLDEPDVYNNLALMRPTDGSRDAELTRLVQSCTRLLYKPTKAGTDTLFMKFRFMSIQIGDLMYKAFPASKGMFLYRNAETWARSEARMIEAGLRKENLNSGEVGPVGNLFRLFDLSRPYGANHVHEHQPKVRSKERPGEKIEMLKRAIPLLPPYIAQAIRSQLSAGDLMRLASLAIAQRLPILRDRFRTPAEFIDPYLHAIPPIKLLVLIWLSVMHRYLAMHNQGIPMLAIQYETLVSAPQPALRAIFEYCGLPAECVGLAEGAFAEDSQKGTILSRERLDKAKLSDLSPELIAQLREVLAAHPPVQTPDYVAPNSIKVSATAT